MMQLVAIGGLALALSIGGLIWQTKRLDAEQERRAAAEAEVENAKAETQALVAASRQHARELANARKQAARQASGVTQLPSDGCLDNFIGDAAVRLLSGQDSEADAASASGR